DPSGDEVGTMQKTERTSPTMGAKPPEGAVVLFDGTTADNFTNGRMTDDKLLMAGVTSKQKFGDCQVHLEFRTPYMPEARGQARDNGVCYWQGRYEVGALASLGRKEKNNGCGALYKTPAPAVNIGSPPLSWQTYDIDYQAAKYDASGNKTADAVITVRHN